MHRVRRLLRPLRRVHGLRMRAKRRRPRRARLMGGEGRHLVLMKFATRQLRGAREGVERSARSRMNYTGPVPTYSGKDYHTHLTLHFQSYDDAERYSEIFRKVGILDRADAAVIYSHKDRVDERPPHVQRRGRAMSTIYEELKPLIRPGEKLELAHEVRPVKYSIFFLLNTATEDVHEVCRAYYHDDGEECKIDKVEDFGQFVPIDMQEKVRGVISS